jgi:tetratricopeptide (TPR) repeat protein
MRSDSVANQLKNLMGNKRLTDNELRNIGFLHTDRRRGIFLFGFSVLRELQRKYPKDVTLLERLANVSEQLNFNDEALIYRRKLVELDSTNPNFLEKYAWLKYTIELRHTSMLTPLDTKESEVLLHKSIKLVADTVDHYRLRLANLFYGTQQYAKAMDQYARTIQIRAKYGGDPNIFDDALFQKLALCCNRLGKNDRAFGFALQAVNINPRNEEARALIYEMWTKGTKKAKLK